MRRRNILFIMADQLRADYHSSRWRYKRLKTPAIDSLAQRGVLFSRAYVNATVCGPSRMSYYTGRSMTSHGSTWNPVPLRVGEPTLGDHLRPLGLRVALVGKTHMTADRTGMARLGVAPDSVEGVFAGECGFEPFERDDGLHPDDTVDPALAYNRFLREQGYEGVNPWHSAANSGETASGELLSGWYMRNARAAAHVAEAHSETAYMTDRAMDFMRDASEAPWCLHLSYIKPHWPYIAPAPYHAVYGPEDVSAANRSEQERGNPHPVYAAYMQHRESRSFACEEVRAAVIPIYMGLVRQIDDHLARLFAFMEERGLMNDTMIVVCSDHGDYLGDHWLGEKELFHEESVRTPPPSFTIPTLRRMYRAEKQTNILWRPSISSRLSSMPVAARLRITFSKGGHCCIACAARKPARGAMWSFPNSSLKFLPAGAHSTLRRTGSCPASGCCGEIDGSTYFMRASVRSCSISRMTQANWKTGELIRPWGPSAANMPIACSNGCARAVYGSPSPTNTS